MKEEIQKNSKNENKKRKRELGRNERKGNTKGMKDNRASDKRKKLQVVSFYVKFTLPAIYSVMFRVSIEKVTKKFLYIWYNGINKY